MIRTIRKRAPGGGRKPRGQFRGKTATLTTRITPGTRAALDRAAQISGLSLSQEVERRLDASVMKERNRKADVLALAEAIAQVIEKVQEATGKHWREDAFTGEAIRRGIDFLISHFAARGTLAVPPRVEEATARIFHEANERHLAAHGASSPLRVEEAAVRKLREANERDRNPAGVGENAAGKVITLIEHFWGWNRDPAQSAVMSDDLYRYWQLLRDLGSGWERAQASIQKERR